MRAFALLTVAGLLLAGCLSPSPTSSPVGSASDAYVPDCSVNPGAAKWPDACTGLASYNPSKSKAEVDLAVNPKDPNNIVVASKDLDAKASDCVWSVAQVTKDGGKTWKTVYVGGDKANRVPALTDFRCVTDPIMAFDANGVFYYAMQAYGSQNLPTVPGAPVSAGAESGFILATSHDGGLTYDSYVPQSLGNTVLLFDDYPRMLVNPKTGSVSTIFNAIHAGPLPIGSPTDGANAEIATTRDGGQTVAPPVFLVGQDSPNDVTFFSGFAATKDGTVYVTVTKGANPDSGAPTDVWIWKSTDDAMTFSEVGKAFQIHPIPRQHGGHKYRTAPFTEMAIDDSAGPHANRIYTFWPENVSGQADVLSRFSDDGGKTWSSPVNIATNAAGDQLFMRPTVGPDGTVHVLFATQAYSGGELLDQVHAWSTDGGLTWQNQRLTNVSYDGDKGVHQDGFPFIGDYNGIRVASDGSVWAAWGDTATGVSEIAFAHIRPK
ncbi:MAG: sialidase family protein [Thermoplasmatota archaeon]